MSQRQQFLPIYYPGTSTSAGATVVRIVGGDTHGPFDIAMRTVHAARVDGRVTPAPGAGVLMRVAMHSSDPAIGLPEPQSVQVAADGRFRFGAVSPGRYTVIAHAEARSAPPPAADDAAAAWAVRFETAPRWWARQEVDVVAEVDVEIGLELRPGRTIAGIVRADGAEPFTAAPLTLTLYRRDWNLASTRATETTVGPDGRFALTGVVPGRYTFRGPMGPEVCSAITSGIDIQDVPLAFAADRDLVVVTLGACSIRRSPAR